MFSHSDVVEKLNFDASTGVFTRKVKQLKHQIGSISGSVYWDGYVKIAIFSKSIPAHRLAWFYVNGNWPSGDIDHIDGNPVNNRISNLRDVPRAVNTQNMNVKVCAVTKRVLPVGIRQMRRGWEAGIFTNKKRVVLGIFATADEAQEEYFKAKRVFHPSFNENVMEVNMPAKVSQELRNAINLIKAGYSISDAARMAKVSRSTIYRSTQYKALVAERKEQQ